MSSQQPLVTFFAGIIAANACHICGMWMGRLVSGRRATMRCIRGKLIASGPRLPAALTALGAVLTAGAFAINLLSLPGLHTWTLCAALCIIGVFVLFAVVAAVMIARPPTILVGADGVELRGTWRRELTPWPQIEADGDDLTWAAESLGIGQALRRRRLSIGARRIVEMRRLDVDAQAVLDTIAHYRDHPEQRSTLDAISGDDIALVRIN